MSFAGLLLSVPRAFMRFRETISAWVGGGLGLFRPLARSRPFPERLFPSHSGLFPALYSQAVRSVTGLGRY
jgi:hypothetical protein